MANPSSEEGTVAEILLPSLAANSCLPGPPVRFGIGLVPHELDSRHEHLVDVGVESEVDFGAANARHDQLRG